MRGETRPWKRDTGRDATSSFGACHVEQTCNHSVSDHDPVPEVETSIYNRAHCTVTTDNQPIMAETTPASDSNDLAAQLEQLKAQATQQYSLKNYSAAADFYSEAAEVQDTINGEMSPQNADLLYQYGRCLYHVAVQNSDVLGGKVARAEEPERKKRKVSKSHGEGSSSNDGAAAGSSLIGDAIKSGEQKVAADGQDGAQDKAKENEAPSNPYFNITGDENWTDSEEEGENDGEDGEADGDEQEDDFATAYEILDMARVLLARKIESYDGDNTKAVEVRQLQERLSDTHDLQAEIALENERFQDAVQDVRESLALKLALYASDDSLVAEAHFKLSLALEFASLTTTADAADGSGQQIASVDEEMRREAAQEMEKAIASCKSRLARETARESSQPPSAEFQHKITDIKDMIADMETRLVDLRNPAASLSALQSGAGGAPGGADDPLRGVLGALLGANKAEQQKKIAEATETANDLTAMVKKGKKKVAVDSPAVPAYEGKGKRKAEEDASGLQVAQEHRAANGNGKKVKFEEPPAAGEE